MKMEEMFSSVETMTKKQRDRLTKKLKEIKTTSEDIKDEISEVVQTMRNILSNPDLDVNEWGVFREEVVKISQSMECLWTFIRSLENNNKEKRINDRRETLQQFVDQGLYFNEMCVDGYMFHIKSGKVRAKEFSEEDDLPF